MKAGVDYLGINRAIACGGWPEIVANPSKNHVLMLKQYVDSLCESDIQEAAGKNLSSAIAKTLLGPLARNISLPVSNRTLIRDIMKSGLPLSVSSFYEYYDALARLFIIDEVPAWSLNIRSASAMRRLPKKVLVDPSLACSLLGIDENSL